MSTIIGALRDVRDSHNPAAVRPGSSAGLSILDLYSGHHDDLTRSHRSRSRRLARSDYHRYRSRSGSDPVASGLQLGREGQDENTALWSRAWRRARRGCGQLIVAPSQWVFLILLGLLAAVAGSVVDGAAALMLSARTSLAMGVGSGVLGSLVWCTWCLVFACIAAAVGHLVSKDAQGSGIPELKSILSGTPTLSHYLSLKVLGSKVVGVVAALGAGLAVGKEGPFVHIAAIMAHQLWSLPWFSRAAQLRGVTERQNLSAAVAAGVTAVFGAPVGGVLFSIEVTSTYYLVGNLWRAFICSIFCVLMFQMINVLKDDDLFADTSFASVRHSGVSWELVSFSVLGVCCGFLASAFVLVTSKLMLLSRALIKGPRTRYLYTVGTALLCSAMTFPAPFLRLGYREVINDLFSVADGDSGDSADPLEEWTSPSLVFSLLVFIVVTFIVAPLSQSLPIPCGLFTPVFTLGAAFGRMFGEILVAAFPEAQIQPGVYAVVGAAAVTSGATQTVSTALIVFELTGQLHHMVPVLLATVFAYSVAGSYSISVYDMLLQVKGLPYLPRAHGKDIYDRKAKDVMHTEPRFLTLAATYAEAADLLAAQPLTGPDGQRMFEFPVVDTVENRMLVGSVHAVELEAALQRGRRMHQLRARRTKQLKRGASAADMEATDALVPLTSPAAAEDDLTPASGGADGVTGFGSGTTHAGTHRADVWMHDQLPWNEAVLPVSSSHVDISVESGDASAADGGGPTSSTSATGGLHDEAGSGQPSPSRSRSMRRAYKLHVDPAPFQVAQLTPLSKVHFLFATCQFAQAFVTSQGRLVGVILKADLSATSRALGLRRRGSGRGAASGAAGLGRLGGSRPGVATHIPVPTTPTSPDHHATARPGILTDDRSLGLSATLTRSDGDEGGGADSAAEITQAGSPGGPPAAPMVP